MKYMFMAASAAMALAGTAHADTFVNGSFENGSLSGWTQGGGYWSGGTYPDPTSYSSGGANYNAGGISNSITSAGFDSRTDNNLRTVYAGDHSARINDPLNNYSVSLIKQTVNNYTDNILTFAYAAVLEDSHGTTDSDAFIITLKDLTAGDTLFTFNLNSATAPGSFTRSSQGWYYTDWVSQTFNIAALGRLGNSFELSLLANDCPYGGHAGYAYLDGFGNQIGGGGTGGGPVPEASTWMMMIAGFGMAGSAMRYRRRKTSVSFA